MYNKEERLCYFALEECDPVIPKAGWNHYDASSFSDGAYSLSTSSCATGTHPADCTAAANAFEVNSGGSPTEACVMRYTGTARGYQFGEWAMRVRKDGNHDVYICLVDPVESFALEINEVVKDVELKVIADWTHESKDMFDVCAEVDMVPVCESRLPL